MVDLSNSVRICTEKKDWLTRKQKNETSALIAKSLNLAIRI